MGKNADVIRWLDISSALFRDLIPMEKANAINAHMRHGLTKAEFGALVDRETNRVNEALIAMSLAKDEIEVHKLFDALPSDAVIALFSRWLRYQGAWTKFQDDTHPPLWVPPRDIWRAIFLAMTDDIPAASDAARLIWGEALKE